MSKRNITYIKPEEPSFLKKIKEQIGYKEGPTVDTKREALEPAYEEDLEDNLEEQPTVIVLKPGDLTADEALKEKERLAREEASCPADLSKPIVFKVSKQEKDQQSSKRKKSEDKQKKTKKSKSLLSFDDEEEEY